MNQQNNRETLIQKSEEIIQNMDTENPSAHDLAELRGIFATQPEIFYRRRNLVYTAEKDAAKTMAPDDPLTQEYILMNAKTIRAQLRYDESPTIEKLLIDQIVVCWIRQYLTESWYSQATTLENASKELIKFCERRLSYVQRRYLRAVESLARIRKINGTTLQVNVAQAGSQQMNFGGNMAKGNS